MRVKNIIYDGDRPVNETKAQALAANEVLRGPLAEHLDTTRRNLRNAIAVGGAMVALGILLLLLNAGLLVSGGLVLLGFGVAGGGYKYIISQTPDIELKSIEKGYWTGYCLPGPEGTIVYDASGSVQTKDFELERLSDNSTIQSAKSQLRESQDFPVVMERDQNVEETVTETLETVKAEFESTEQHTVEAPIISANSPAAQAVRTFASHADDESVETVTTDISATEAKDEIAELDELEEMAAADETEADLETLSDTSRQLVSDLSGMQETAVDLLNGHIASAADAFGFVSYNFYCPTCMEDDIESQLEFSDPHAGTWYCSTCRNRHETSAVIPRHRIKDDIVDPVWNQLWIEKDDQKREIYSNIEDQKAELEEREFEQQQEEIRTTTDRIRDLRADIRELQTQAKASEGKVDEIGSLMVKYEHINEQKKRQFTEDVEASFAEIDAKTEEILEATRNEEQERIEQAEQEAKEKATLIRQEELRKERDKLQAQFEHQEELHDEERAQEAKQHRENWLLKTRGKTSVSGTINKVKMKKDRFWRQSTYNGGD